MNIVNERNQTIIRGGGAKQKNCNVSVSDNLKKKIHRNKVEQIYNPIFFVLYIIHKELLERGHEQSAIDEDGTGAH